METTFDEFKLRVLKQVSDLYLKEDTNTPILCFQDGDGKNRLLRLPPEVFRTASYKEFLPGIIGRMLRDTEAKHVALIMECVMTSIDTTTLSDENSFGEGEVAKSVARKIIEHRDTDKEPSFNEEEHRIIVEVLGKSRIVFLFQSKTDKDAFLSFTKDDQGRLQPSSEKSEGEKFKGAFANLFKFE